MPFEIEVEGISKDSKRIMPISMGQRYHSGEHLQALVAWAKGTNTTILVADYLQRHNLGDEKKALDKGNQFLKQNEAIFKELILVDGLENWEKYKNLSHAKIMRWKTWEEICPREVDAAKALLEENSKAGSHLLKAMERTAARCFSAFDKESSIKYQKEENAYLLTFDCFDDHLYPRPLNDSQAEVYKQFPSKLPKHRIPRFVNLAPGRQNVSYGEFWAGSKPDEQKKYPVEKAKLSLHPALRMALMNIEMVLNSHEISPKAKEEFIRQCNNIFASSEASLLVSAKESESVESVCS